MDLFAHCFILQEITKYVIQMPQVPNPSYDEHILKVQ